MRQKEKKLVAVGLLLVFVVALGMLMWVSGRVESGRVAEGVSAESRGSLAGFAATTPSISGLVSSWSFDDECETGGKCADDAGTNSGTPMGNPVFVPGIKGTAIALDGTTSKYVIMNPINNFPSTEITTTFWVKTSDSGDVGIFSYAISSQANAFLIYSSSSLKINIMGTSIDTSVKFNDNQWHQVVVTWRNSDGLLIVYKDGVENERKTGIKTGTTLTSNGALVFGQEQDSVGGGFETGQAFKGLLDEVQLYNRALTADEITALYNSYDIVPAEPTNYVSRWEFDESSATSKDLTDVKGFHNGVLFPATGGTWKRIVDARGVGKVLQFSGNAGEFAEINKTTILPSSALSAEVPGAMLPSALQLQEFTISTWVKVDQLSSDTKYDGIATTRKGDDGWLLGIKNDIRFFTVKTVTSATSADVDDIVFSSATSAGYAVTTAVATAVATASSIGEAAAISAASAEARDAVVAAVSSSIHDVVADAIGDSDADVIRTSVTNTVEDPVNDAVAPLFTNPAVADTIADAAISAAADAVVTAVTPTDKYSALTFPSEKIGKWVHVVATKKGAEQCIYLDGIITPAGCIEDAAATITYDNSASLVFGTRIEPGYTNQAFHGALDDFRIYSSALTTDQIKSLYLNGHTAPCFNKYCPPVNEVEQLLDVESDNSLIQKAKQTLQSYLGSKTLEATTKDIYTAHLPQFRTATSIMNRITDTLSAPENLLYFKHNKKNYLVQLKEAQQYDMTAKISVRSVTGETEEIVQGLATDAGTPLYFSDLSSNKRQVGLDLDTGKEGLEAYLQSLGYYDQQKRLGLVVGVTPFMDFDQIPEWTAVFMNGQPQKFQLDGVADDKKIISISTQGDKILLSIGGSQYPLEGKELKENSEATTHFFDDLETIGIQFTVNKIGDEFAVITFTRLPPSLEQGYEREFTQEIPTTLELKTLRICKTDPPLLAAVTVCDGEENELFDLLDGQPKTVDAFPDVLFFYERESDVNTPKRVQAFHLFRFADDQTTELSTFFAHNLDANRRLALELDGQQYLLQKNSEAKSADLTQLELLRISGNKLGLSSEKWPRYLSSGNSLEETDRGTDFLVKFNLPLGRQINLKLIDDAPLSHQITPVTKAVPDSINLVDLLHTVISTYGSSNILDKTGSTALGIINVDPSDITTFKNFMKIATKKGAVELAWKVPKIIPDIQLNDGFQKGKVLALYDSFAPDISSQEGEFKFTKKAKLFLLYDLNEGSKTHEFSDKHFIIPLFAGGGDAQGGLAFAVDGKYYLLHYAAGLSDAYSNGFDLNSESSELLQLLPLPVSEGATSLVSSLSEDQKTVTFTLNEQKSIQLVFDTDKNKVTFNLVSKEAGDASVAKTLNLMQNFQTSEGELLTSFHPVNILNSDLKVVSIHKDDLQSFQKVMRIASGSKDKELGYRIPQAWGTISGGTYSSAKVLFHYSQIEPMPTAEPTQIRFEKFAKLTLLYDLDEGVKTKAFTGIDLIDPLLAGKEFAIKAFDKYYLLGHESSSAGFTYDQLQLKTLEDGVLQSRDTTVENQASFTVKGGFITLKFDAKTKTLTMSLRKAPAESGEAGDIFAPEKEYSRTILSGLSSNPGIDNVLQVGSLKFYNCDSQTTFAFTESVFFCISSREQRLQKDMPVIENVENGKVLLWYKGMTAAGKKEVALHYVLGEAEDEMELEWETLTDTLALGKSPVILLSGKAYLLMGGTQLNSFALKEIPSAQPPLKVTLTSTSEGEQEAQVSVHGQIMRFKQQLERQQIQLTLDVLPYVLLSPEGVTAKDTDFISALGQPKYSAHAVAEGNFMVVTLKDENGENFFVMKLPFGESRQVLLPNGQVLTVHASIDPAKGEGVRLSKP